MAVPGRAQPRDLDPPRLLGPQRAGRPALLGPLPLRVPAPGGLPDGVRRGGVPQLRRGVRRGHGGPALPGPPGGAGHGRRVPHGRGRLPGPADRLRRRVHRLQRHPRGLDGQRGHLLRRGHGPEGRAVLLLRSPQHRRDRGRGGRGPARRRDGGGPLPHRHDEPGPHGNDPAPRRQRAAPSRRVAGRAHGLPREPGERARARRGPGRDGRRGADRHARLRPRRRRHRRGRGLRGHQHPGLPERPPPVRPRDVRRRRSAPHLRVRVPGGPRARRDEGLPHAIPVVGGLRPTRPRDRGLEGVHAPSRVHDPGDRDGPGRLPLRGRLGPAAHLGVQRDDGDPCPGDRGAGPALAARDRCG